MLGRLSPFGRFSLIGQLYAAFSLVALLLAGAASYAVYALSQTDADGKRTDEFARLADRALLLDLRLTQVRNSLNIWLQASSDDQAADADRRLEAVKETLDAIRAERLDAEQRAAIDEFGRVFESYATRTWPTIRRIDAENRTILGALDRVGPPNRTAIQRGRDAAEAAGRRDVASALNEAAEHYMLGRVRAMRFRGSRSDADIEGANRAFADTLAALTRARAAGAAGAEIDGYVRTVESYRDEYGRYRAGVARIWELRTTFRAEGNRMSELSNTVRDRAFAAKSRAEESTDAALSGRQTTVTALTALAAILALLVAWGLAASLKGPLNRLVDAARRLSSGDDKVRLAADGRKDEIGDLTAAMSKLCVTVGEAFKLRQMVEDMPTAVITADLSNDFRIDYANKATIETLRTLEAHINVKAENIVGQSIDIFHRDPGHQRRMLSDPANLPHRAKIRLGGETLDLRVSAMRDRAGTYIGPMLSWTIVTKQVKLAD
ncbi:MAG: HAMP domain-containing protein, partial [Azospirillum sp.]|nr:HAMP domain-containing protein [Azospirillum sp.]